MSVSALAVFGGELFGLDSRLSIRKAEERAEGLLSVTIFAVKSFSQNISSVNASETPSMCCEWIQRQTVLFSADCSNFYTWPGHPLA